LVRIRIIAVGKDKEAWVSQGCRHFETLLRRYATVEWTVVPGAKGASSLSPNQIRKTESEQLRQGLINRGAVVALSDDGEKHDSRSFARNLERLYVSGGGLITFLVGGPYGLDEAIKAAADRVLSLSPLTFSHQLVRLVLLEQLYRAFSLIHDTGYHK
jgi:23S rRNA (pseudouridine1915-N3)-methyltransferase